MIGLAEVESSTETLSAAIELRSACETSLMTISYEKSSMIMNATYPKERATFSIDSTVKKRLDRVVPKSKRSSFVEYAIERALREAEKRKALAQIRAFKPYPLKGPGVVETLDQVRVQRGEQLAASDRNK
jgi:hypothetical protein